MINIRKAESKDISFISDVCVETNDIYSEIMPGAFLKQSEKYKNNGLPSTFDMYIINSEGKDIGFLGLQSIDNDTVYLPAIYLKKDFYRKSYGSKTLDLLFNQLKANGKKEILLQAHEKARWAINFYKKHGFVIDLDKQIDGVKIINNTIIMRKDLTL